MRSDASPYSFPRCSRSSRSLPDHPSRAGRAIRRRADAAARHQGESRSRVRTRCSAVKTVFPLHGGLIHGDFGPSFKFQRRTRFELIGQGLPVSLALGACAVLLAILVGVPLGALAALRRNHAVDHAIRGVAVLGIALPSFVVGPVLALVFGLYLHWLPVAGWEGGEARYMILPVVTLALPVMAYVARLARASFLEVMRANHIRTARAKGLE